MVTEIKDYKRIAGSVKPDPKRRVVLPNALVWEGVTFHIYHNSRGQILLDPQVTIPASELWVFENKNILTAMDKSMAEERVINRGSFAEYVKNAP